MLLAHIDVGQCWQTNRPQSARIPRFVTILPIGGPERFKP